MIERYTRIHRTLPAAAVLAVALAIPAARAEERGEVVYPPAYDGFQAGRDAQAYAEARRRDAINRQLGWNELFKARAAAAQSGATYYEPYLPYAPNAPYAPAFDAPYWMDAYGYGRIYGYGFYDAVPQPIGRRQVQTGPNRWESHPVYAEDVIKRPAAVDVPTVPPTAAPPAVAPPKVGSPKPRLREF